MRSSCALLLSLAWASAFRAPAPTRVAPPLRATAQEISALTGGVETVFTLEEVQKILPHRYPFALVDKVVAYEPGESAVGIKQITFNEPQFGGHFPDRPIMPGVMQIEALAQLAGVVCLQMEGAEPGAVFFFAGVAASSGSARRPGDTLVMEVEITNWKAKFGIAKATGRAYVDGNLAVEPTAYMAKSAVSQTWNASPPPAKARRADHGAQDATMTAMP
ncbi:FabA-like domain-containing protein [Aureococcus anophagefferens]|nr:FabA-like domain-containing protein [Aureococcus anophagefferens]